MHYAHKQPRFREITVNAEHAPTDSKKHHFDLRDATVRRPDFSPLERYVFTWT
jgi:hypothetical protein